MFSMLRNGFVFLWVSAVLGTGHGDTDSVPRTTPAPPLTSGAAISTSAGPLSSNSTGTCPSRTVNYITHTLVQKCLRTDRVSPNSTQNLITSAAASPGEFTTTTSLDDRPQVVTVTSTVTNETITTTIENSGEVQESISSQDSSIPTASPVNEALATPSPSIEEEADSALDNANFLSFEDWKKQNLAKSGQSPEDIGKLQTNAPHRPRPVNNALDTLGDDQEIDIDFAGFGAVSQPPLPERTASATEENTAASNPTSLRSRDAGKTCKERTNYASFDCAATVLKSNKEAKSATSVLIESKDSYMLNKCSADNKFFIVELCNDIQIDTVVLANYEFFSSGFRHFRLSVSDRYPVKMEKWKDLGTFEARNTREIQAFLIENPQIWARYLRIEFLTHYGTEYYCPVSLLRVHGITMMEDYRHQEELASGEDDDVTLDAEALATPPIHQEPVELTDEASKATEQAIPPVVEADPKTTPVEANSTEETSSSRPVTPVESVVSGNIASSAESPPTVAYSNGSVPMQVGVYEPTNANMTCDPPATSESAASSRAEQPASSRMSSGEEQIPITEMSAPTSITTNSSTITTQSTSAGAPTGSSIESLPTAAVKEQTPPSVSRDSNTTSGMVTAVAANSSISTNQTTSASTNSTRVAASSTSSPPPAQPSTQESFFKSVHKRLQQLESNSTLSLQYIEEQSRILREAFSKVEKRQVSTTSKFLTQLNETVMVELHGFRQAYDQLWQSTVIELEGQRETYQREMLALSSRLTMVADELVWQKRLGIVQSTLVLMCLALVLFGRSGNGAIEMPLMQQLLNKSTTALSGWDSPPNSPSPDSRSPVSLFRRKLWRSSTAPAEAQYVSDDGSERQKETADAPEISVEAPSPPRQANHDEWEDEDENQGDTSPKSARKPNGSSTPGSPGKRKKKQKRPSSGWIPSGITFAGQGSGIRPARAKSPLAHGEWAE